MTIELEMAGRVTVRLEHPRNVMYVRVLQVWKENATEHESKMVYALFNAMKAIKACPLSIDGFEGLKRLNGVGDVIASRLEACWEILSFEMGDDIKSVTKVKETLTKEKTVYIFDATKKVGKHKGRVPSLKQAPPATSKAAPKRLSSSQIPSTSRADDDEFVEKDDVVPVKMARFNSDPMLSKASSRSNSGQTTSNGPSTSISAAGTGGDSDDDDEDEGGMEYVCIEPRDNVEVILIMDNAEKNGNAKSSVVDLLEKKDIRVDRRRLSIGDYMWIAKKIDGTEMCMDWVVERKTWGDLDSSIKKSRYQEQKQRLRAAPFTNRVYLIEGQREGQSHLQQALVTTMVHDNFLIQRTLSCHKSAEFLVSLTKRLQQQVRSEKMVRPTFASVQSFSKKSASIDRLSDIWTRMLMVVPGMSADSAKLVAERFPSIKALMTLWKEEADPEKRLLKEVPSLGRVQAANISLFFELGMKK
ncbi:mus-81 [Pristionchus pacificus]|uniref:Crossover junction endonuclease MUS81 n=1 Tax=Pristionchus pacificus TaxID=54126 RepID=A0A2A6BVD0_PRIPA|nr:mus-81 [Pristionchus pacificus]|eukprot:PDM69817.1 mus-81 [Pristionchus pacificus]